VNVCEGHGFSHVNAEHHAEPEPYRPISEGLMMPASATIVRGPSGFDETSTLSNAFPAIKYL